MLLYVYEDQITFNKYFLLNAGAQNKTIYNSSLKNYYLIKLNFVFVNISTGLTRTNPCQYFKMTTKDLFVFRSRGEHNFKEGRTFTIMDKFRSVEKVVFVWSLEDLIRQGENFISGV